jgi:hypothetical protein
VGPVLEHQIQPVENSLNRWHVRKIVRDKVVQNLTLRTLLASKKLTGGRIPHSPDEICWRTLQNSCLNQW